jgi:hypothetical protein
MTKSGQRASTQFAIKPGRPQPNKAEQAELAWLKSSSSIIGAAGDADDHSQA